MTSSFSHNAIITTDGGQGPNPEQPFAAAYAACFIGALKVVAGQAKIALPSGVYINSELSIGRIENGIGIAAKLTVSLGYTAQA